MEPEDKKPDVVASPPETAPSEAPVDALSMTPEELGETQAKPDQTGENVSPADKKAAKKAGKKPSGLRRFLRKANLYFLMFVILLVVAGAIAVVTYLQSQKDPVEPSIGSQQLSEEALEDLANKDASVGNARQQLTIKGNAIIDGHTLLRSGVDIAGRLQTSGRISGPDLTISGASNLGTAQINSLQIASNNDIQGDATIGGKLSVAGTSTFNGPVTTNQITTSKLKMSGNAKLEVPNHLDFTGPTPSRDVNYSALGSGSSASISGSDTSGTVNLNSGSNPKSGCFVTINFRTNFGKTPRVVASPIDAAAGNLRFYIQRDAAKFKICSTNSPAANARFAFDYLVAG